MKKYAFIPVAAMIALAGCTHRTDDQDRTFLAETRTMAEQAKNDAAQAAQDAKAARDDAKRAAAEAKTASERSDRIFQQGQNK